MQLRRDYHQFLEQGYDVVAIGHGTPLRAAKYREELKLPFPILADREQQAYAAYGLGLASISSLVNPKLYLGGARALLAGSRLSKTSGDPRQLPGTFIIDRGGIVRFAKAAAIASDLATTGELLAWIECRQSVQERTAREHRR